MNAPFDPSLRFTEKLAVGQPVSRMEDPVLLRGEGRYSDDLNRTGQLYGVMVRSRVAHGILRSIDTEAAREMPGVRAGITLADLDAAGIKNMPAAAGKHRDGSPTPRPPQRPLATDRVRYVGEPIAMVVAETNKEAKDAAEAIFVDIDQLPAVTTASAVDYGLPRASDLPTLGVESHPVPARTNPLGAKGRGEAGCAGSLPAVMNAVVDALSEFGITHIDMPATPHRIW